MPSQPSPSPSSPHHAALTRRSLLGAAAGGAAALTYGALPAWAKPVARLAGVRRPDSLPFPHMRAGTESLPQIKHVVVLMMENHSFDNLLGMVPHRVPGRRNVDGFTLAHGQPVEVNLDTDGTSVPARPMSSPCQLVGHPGQDWNASHLSWDAGRNDGFVKASGPVAMSFWDNTDLPFTYSLVKHFPVGNRYFCSVLAQTYPNRRYLFTGTSSGLVGHRHPDAPAPGGQRHHLRPARRASRSAGQTTTEQAAQLRCIVPGFLTVPVSKRVAQDRPVLHGRRRPASCPPFTFLDPDYDTTIGGEPAGHPGRRALRGRGGQGADRSSPAWDKHGAVHHLRRARRLLRPRAAAARDHARQHRADPGAGPGAADARGLRPLRLPRAGVRHLTVGSRATTSPMWLRITPRSWRSSNASGTCRHSTIRVTNAHPMTDYFDFSKAGV